MVVEYYCLVTDLFHGTYKILVLICLLLVLKDILILFLSATFPLVLEHCLLDMGC